ncbi:MULTISPECIES: helix-turn-helix transcriptional regulator [unclassified Sphingobium]|uniref:S24 family peptidase n=1 Tax=unclassified Sphingobium TaxID=2611147 RepID=UPI0022248E0B|nr:MULTISPECIES: S24 family peptidase [unclassified Sphingobium]MCW2395863.1 phage repressor protein C with HTH and peptisase S24 domain [Sphingobium sp. B8D3B]MCW2419379.1 phage repressor protein C with HTH and peptisase S24 domain [Sphingobium sp. B8D3C]
MEKTALQRFIAGALSLAPQKRDYYDKLIQKRTGSTGKPIYDIERGKSTNPGIKVLVLIAETLNQPLDLLTRAVSGEDVEPVDQWDGVAPDQPPVVSASLGETIALKRYDLGYSMGDGTNLDDYQEEGSIDFDAGLLRTITSAPFERLIVAEGEGDSMFPTILNKDLLVIDTGQRDLRLLDKIYAISLFGAGGLKRLRPLGHNRVLVISDNPNRENQEVDASDVFILGRLIWSGRQH